jgi:hypothetical protein
MIKRGFAFAIRCYAQSDVGVVANMPNVLRMYPSLRSVPGFTWRSQVSARFDD